MADAARDLYQAPRPSYGASSIPEPVRGETRYKSARRGSDVFPGGFRDGDADTDTLSDLPTLRRRSAEAVRNNPMALAAITGKVTHVVGTGLRLNASIDRDLLGISDDEADAWEAAAEAEWRLFSESTNCDARRTLNFREQQDLAFRSVLERGDHFVSMVTLDQPRPGWPFGFALQHIEADRVSNPNNQRDTDRLIAGVEKDAFGAPVRYHVSNVHPGAVNRYGQTQRWQALRAFGERTGRRLVLHLFRTLREGQTRGVPDLAPVLEVFKQMDRYIDAEVDRAVNSALFMAFVTTADGEGFAGIAGDSLADDRQSFYQKFQQRKYAIDHSSIASLFPGDSMEFADPKSPNPNADGFISTFARITGAALELPQEVLLRHFSSSYSAARGALLMAWQFFHGRRAWLASAACQPIYEAVLTDAITQGRLAAPGFVSDPLRRQAWVGSEWIGDAPGHIDENKAVNAARDRIEIGVSTLKRETAALTGQDYDAVRRQRDKERRQSDDAMPDAVEDPPSADELDQEDARP